ncbi:FxLYD domain-containing protein [Slackia heliotrinireducens]|uniref:FxLYD domain-containing protein n=1 Tax=Slackia heliotrinireducens TaxID=84110 RepID=UPI0033148286
MRLNGIGICAAAVVTLALVLCGCSNSNTALTTNTEVVQNETAEEGVTEPDYADDEAMAIIAEGLEARWAINASAGSVSTADSLRTAVNAEFDIVKTLRDRQFEDPKMQEDVLSYINMVEDSLDVLDNYSYESVEFDEQWLEVYNDRTMQIKYFVDTYGLTVNERYQAELNELLTNGTVALNESEREEAVNGLFEGVEFEKVSDGYGYYEYTAVVENTTEYNFENFGIVLSLYDSEDVKVQETFAYVNSWEKGEKVTFEAFTDVDAERVSVSVDYYSVVD